MTLNPHSNEYKTEDSISVLEKYYNFNGAKKVNFNEMLSLYARMKFTTTSIIEELLDFFVDTNDSDENKYNVIKDYIDKRYPLFKKIDISNVNIENVWDWLEMKKKQYGDEFLLCPIK